MKVFNTTAVCVPSKHYMVDLTERIAEIRKLVDVGKYFTINRARQYGKTTTLNALKQNLQDEYIVLSLSFEGIGDAGFATEASFVREFCRLLRRKFRSGIAIPPNVKDEIERLFQSDSERINLGDLFDLLLEWCAESERKIVLLIDEVDSATNNQVFLDFLAQLRDNYINRDTEDVITFHSVILAGVTDIKHLKSKIRPDAERKENSPWNIAADFNIDMSLSEAGIKGMLDEYEADHHTGMDTAKIAGLIWNQTSGYPFLVSRICQLIDEQVCQSMPPSEAWTRNGFNTALRLLLAESNALFQSITKNLNNYPRLKDSIRSILMEGKKMTYNSDQDDIVQMEMLGLIRRDHNTVRISNIIFETRLYNLFLSESEFEKNAFYETGSLNRNQFIQNGRLDMVAVLNGFIRTYNQVYGPLSEKFKEKDGRELFLLYLKPIINGTGNFYIEAQTRDQLRTDVIVDYLGEQYILELKIWNGSGYHESGEQQLCEYLDRFDLKTGYMLTFNFNQKKEQGIREVKIGDKTLYEATL